MTAHRRQMFRLLSFWSFCGTELVWWPEKSSVGEPETWDLALLANTIYVEELNKNFEIPWGF